jgi:undecaprenyl-phosphate galactose phosphotransferase
MDVLAATERQLEMRSRRVVREGWLLAAADLVVILACFVAARIVNYWFSGIPWRATWHDWAIHVSEARPVIFVALGLACVIAFWRLGHYARRRPFWQELGDVLAVALVLAVVDAALVFLTKTNFSRLWWAASWSLVALAVPLTRLAVKHLLISLGAWRRPTVVVGIGPNALDAARALESEPLLGFEVVAMIQPPGAPAPEPAYLEVGSKRLPVLRAAPYPDLLPAHLGRPHVVVALELDEMAECGGYVERLNLHYGDVDVVSPMRGLPLAGTYVTHFFSHDVLSLRLYNNLARPWPRRLKRGFDLVAGSLLCLFVAPLLLLISAQVARTGRPVFYRHQRIGKGGKPFVCFKFRTMVADAEAVLAAHLAAHPEALEEWRRDHKLKDDPRITRFGAWLRRTSLDELPQLFNVLRGEMSLVGPRPVIAEELVRYGESRVYYVESTPGLTGLWQISGRNDLDYRRRVHLDCWYVKNWSLWYDLVILLKTPRAVLRGHGAY